MLEDFQIDPDHQFAIQGAGLIVSSVVAPTLAHANKILLPFTTSVPKYEPF
jgi:hypothetical protein